MVGWVLISITKNTGLQSKLPDSTSAFPHSITMKNANKNSSVYKSLWWGLGGAQAKSDNLDWRPVPAVESGADVPGRMLYMEKYSIFCNVPELLNYRFSLLPHSNVPELLNYRFSLLPHANMTELLNYRFALVSRPPQPIPGWFFATSRNPLLLSFFVCSEPVPGYRWRTVIE